MKKELIDFIIITKLEELLNSIQSNFKDLITTKNIEEDIKYIVKNITYSKYNNTTKNTNNEKGNKNKKIKKIDYRKNLEINDRCEGRIWGKITENNNTKIYGCRCKNKKQKNSKYCFVHNSKLTHGNFLEKPDKFVKHHFETFYSNKKSSIKIKKF